MSVAEDAAREVEALHDFFEAWFRGELPRTNDAIARLESALGGEFRLIHPDGTVSDREAVIDGVEAGHGANRDEEPPFRIQVEAVEPRIVTDDACLVTYEEHQRPDGEWRGRRSSAWFERAPNAPCGVVWRHLHETWLED